VYSWGWQANEYVQVDAFVVVHAGRAAEETMNGRDIWSVKWTLPMERSVDGEKLFSTNESNTLTVSTDVKIYGFLTVPEDAKCGVCAHEIGHLGEIL
jgi:immune inhibitor A